MRSLDFCLCPPAKGGLLPALACVFKKTEWATKLAPSPGGNKAFHPTPAEAKWEEQKGLLPS